MTPKMRLHETPGVMEAGIDGPFRAIYDRGYLWAREVHVVVQDQHSAVFGPKLRQHVFDGVAHLTLQYLVLGSAQERQVRRFKGVIVVVLVPRRFPQVMEEVAAAVRFAHVDG